MTLDDEIQAVEDVVRAARDAATEHLDRAAKDLHLGVTGLAHYKDFLDATLSNARSVLAHCRALASVPDLAAEASTTRIAQGLLGVVRESMRSMYVAMAVLERFADATGRGGSAPATGPRSCSFCGKTEAETKLVAGPRANICAACTRLACGVLGI